MFPIIPANSAASLTFNDEGIFGYGSGYSNTSNLVSNTGVVSSDVTGVGTARSAMAACEFGGDKGIFGFGYAPGGYVGMTNLVSNTGVVADDVTAVGSARGYLMACSFGEDEGIFGFGSGNAPLGPSQSMTNLVSNAGVISSDVTGVTGVTGRGYGAACEYGGDKGIFGYGDGSIVSMTNPVSNTGVVAADVAGVGTARQYLAACGYGGDKGIFGFGYENPPGGPGNVGMTNLVSNTGVVADDVTAVGTARSMPGATQYGGNRGIFSFGTVAATATNLVSNAGVVASDVTQVGTARNGLGGCSFA